MAVYELLGPLLSLCGSLMGLAYVWGKVKQNLETHEQEIKQLKGGLYNPDGTLVYMPRSECMEQRNRCGNSVTVQLGEVKAMIADLRTEMLNNTRNHNHELQKLMKFVGRVEEHIRGVKN